MPNITEVHVLLFAALVFQLVGVYLVVQELRRTSQLTGTLSDNLSEITEKWDNAHVYATELVAEELEDDGIFAPIAVEAVATDERVRVVNDAVHELARYSTEVNHKSTITAIAGPSSLALGIILSFAAGIASTLPA